MNRELINRPCTLLLRAPTGSEDEYGNPTRDEAEFATVCEVQQRNRSEAGDAGETGKGEWIGFFLPEVTDLNTGDAVLVGEEKYELVGPPWLARDPFTQTDSHVEADLVQVKGAGDGGGS